MKVINFEQNAFNDFLAESLKELNNDSIKLLILGIKEGGSPLAINVYDFLKYNSKNQIELNFITCQRPSTYAKKNKKFLKYLIQNFFKILPLSVLDILRVMEFKILTNSNLDTARHIIVENEIDYNKYDKILIIDDAVDSGLTLKKVSDYIGTKKHESVAVESLAVVVTNENTMMMPDYFLYKNVLIRFPWSLDG
ncbi:phosphoribosyltransferase family protein [Faecalibacter rhinopitheci]|uniref:Phosphoribosyltransferase domain-containing protein n=1 Tax=Faecalibacter rhinopitheci TaxID=2779678 RepID=A0A8J7FQS0_9FLAO|nr:phosphoribosyltransferase family protein [Faecalibacter rhinopitheci]MBF0596608.1 hypothetical protein [Faecalibacter rhinopitheci]